MEETIRRAETPGEAKKLGQTRKVTLRSDWEQVKDDIMRECLRAKFTQHENIRMTLLKTGDALLVEHTRNGTPLARANPCCPPLMLMIRVIRTQIDTGAMEGTDRARTCWASSSWKYAMSSASSTPRRREDDTCRKKSMKCVQSIYFGFQCKY